MSAVISDCGQYRYTLHRDTGNIQWERGHILFVMLNPSTADAHVDDPTIRRCIGFARAWGYPGMAVVNLYALRSTDPKQLWHHPDPVGPENNTWLHVMGVHCGDVVCAWGANARPDRVATVVEIFTAMGARLWCLGTTKAGHPRHPLYIPADQSLERWMPLGQGGPQP